MTHARTDSAAAAARQRPVLGPPSPEQRVMEDLIRTGTVDPENLAEARGLADWEPPTRPPGMPSPSDALLVLREEEDR